ncbi:arsenate reductase (glutaredoxin) [Alteromonadaceae bacterium M269]|nr:arsenate reductase (glutaredoxin) [Alteromonadaceae bacterium M269]
MTELTIFHNPRCSKSRQTLQLLTDKDLSPVVFEYLKTPPTVEELRNILNLLGFDDARQLMRKKEAEYKELELDNSALSQDDLIKAMVETPKLIERPIVINNGQARIGRPPESVLEIL